MEKLKQMLSPSHDAADKKDSDSPGSAGTAGRDQGESTTHAPSQATSGRTDDSTLNDQTTAYPTQAPAPAETESAGAPSKAERLMGSNLSQVHDTRSTTTGPSSTDPLAQENRGDSTLDPSSQYTSGAYSSPIASRDATSGRESQEPFAGPKGSAQPLSGSRDAPSQPQELNPTPDSRYDQGSAIPHGTGGVASGAPFGARDDGRAATSDPRAPAITESREAETPNISGLPGTFPEQTPTEPPPSAEYFNRSYQDQKNPASSSAGATQPMTSSTSLQPQVGAPNSSADDGRSTPLAAGTSTAPTTSDTTGGYPTNTMGTTDRSKEGLASQSEVGPEDSHTKQYAAMGAAAAAGGGAAAYGGHEYSQRRADAGEPDRLTSDRAREQPSGYQGQSGYGTEAPSTSLMGAPKPTEQHQRQPIEEKPRAERDYGTATILEQKTVSPSGEQYRDNSRGGDVFDKHEEERMRQDSDDKDKKKGGLLGMFKRRRDSKGNELDDDTEDGSSPSGGYKSGKDKHQGMNRLTKAPPAGLYAGDSATPAHSEYAVRENDHPGAQTIMGGYTAPPDAHDQDKYRNTHTESGKVMPPTDQSRDSRYDSDTRQYTDAKMKGESHESQYGDGASGIAPGIMGRDNPDTMGRDSPGMMGRDNPGMMGRDNPGTMGPGGNDPMMENRGTGGMGSGRDKDDIVLHSDGSRRYKDGSSVDPPSQTSGQHGTENPDKFGHGDDQDGGHHSKMGKVLEKLHLK